MSRDEPLSWGQVHWLEPLAADRALALLVRLAADAPRPPVVLEARGSDHQVEHFIGTTPSYIAQLSSLFETHVHAAFTTTPPTRERLATNARLFVSEQRLPLAVDRLAVAVRSIFAALSSAGPNEQLTLQVVLGRGIPPTANSRNQVEPISGLATLLAGPRPVSAETARTIRHKATQPGFHATLRLAATSGHPLRERTLIEGLLAGLRTLQSPGSTLSLRHETPARTRDASPPRIRALHLSADEVLALVGWPIDTDRLPGMPPTHPKLLPLPAGKQDTTRPFAIGTHPATQVKVGISITDSLVHTAIIGPTNSGKSTVLLNLIHADLAAGRSIVVIDPKADLVRDVLAIAPKHRHGDIVILDPTHDRPVGLNPLQRAPGVSAELVVDGILTIFRQLYPTLFGPRTADVLHNSLLVLARSEHATLTWLPRLLSDSRTRAGILAKLDLTDDEASFWIAWEAMSERQRAQFAGPVLSRLRQYLNRPSLRRILDQPVPRFDLSELFTGRRVLLVPLNSAVVGAEAGKLLGALLVSRLWNLTLSRSTVDPAQRTPVSIYIDEAAQFLKLGDVADALAMSRSYGTAWTLAFQYRAQFPPDTRAAVDANALNTIVFGLGSSDAKDYAAMTRELTPEDFLALGKHEIYLQVVRDGHRAGWASARTSPPPPAINDPTDLIAASQARWGRADDPQSKDQDTAPSKPDASTSNEPPPAIGRRKRSRP